eukprot:1185465-Prorocentrum_minimum.AAC.3
MHPIALNLHPIALNVHPIALNIHPIALNIHTIALKDPVSFPRQAYSLGAFRQAFSVVLQRVLYLPSAGVLALVPFVDGVQSVGSEGALLDYDSETGSVKIMANTYYTSGDKASISSRGC